MEELIAQGYHVAGTSRSKESLEKNIGAESDHFLPLSMNVKDEADVKKAIAQATEKFGRIDVVVNNAGFTHLATIEEMSDADAREEFDINVFGTLNVIRSVLPQMRTQKFTWPGAYTQCPGCVRFWGRRITGHTYVREESLSSPYKAPPNRTANTV